MFPENDPPDPFAPDPKQNRFLQKIQAAGLLGLHLSLIITFLLMIFAIFAVLAPLQEAGQNLFMILGSVTLALLSCFANIRSTQLLIKALKKQVHLPPVDYTTLVISTVSVFVVLALFIDFS